MSREEMCKALGIEHEATSPSFTIINEYEARGAIWIYHFDFYRIENEAELLNLGLDEFFYNDYICLIEWADKIEIINGVIENTYNKEKSQLWVNVVIFDYKLIDESHKGEK